MSNTATPKEKLTAYERWELPNFESSDKTAQSKAPVAPKQNINEESVILPTAAQLEEIQRQAHYEGYQAGYAEGAQRVAAMMAAMEQALQQSDQAIAQDLLNLSLEVARQMVQQSLKTNPEILLNIIREAISSLPHFSHGFRVCSNNKLRFTIVRVCLNNIETQKPKQPNRRK